MGYIYIYILPTPTGPAPLYRYEGGGVSYTHIHITGIIILYSKHPMTAVYLDKRGRGNRFNHIPTIHTYISDSPFFLLLGRSVGQPVGGFRNRT